MDDNKYIGDLLADFKAAKDRSKGEILHCKLTFKRKLFRESDEAIGDPMFVQLCYVQVRNPAIGSVAYLLVGIRPYFLKLKLSLTVNILIYETVAT